MVSSQQEKESKRRKHHHQQQQQQQQQQGVGDTQHGRTVERKESKALQYILQNQQQQQQRLKSSSSAALTSHSLVQTFFDEIYQTSVMEYRHNSRTPVDEASSVSVHQSTEVMSQQCGDDTLLPSFHVTDSETATIGFVPPPKYTPWMNRGDPNTTTTTPTTTTNNNNNNNNNNYDDYDGCEMEPNPYTNILKHGHSILYDLMNQEMTLSMSSSSNNDVTTATTSKRENDDDDDDDDDVVGRNCSHPNINNNNNNNNNNNILLFQNQQMVSSEEIITKYSSHTCIRTQQQQQNNKVGTGNSKMDIVDDEDVDTDDRTIVNLYAAYLDGCSIVMNHADTYHPYLAQLCQDLSYSFPHVYANIYLTPPATQTVPAHADDRDVFIIQIMGCKLWTIYTNVPIPYPYPSEQVGKSTTLPVPESVLRGPILYQSILYPGDVLYIPRGYVHEAQSVQSSSLSPTTPPSGSFHITIAIATHDWSLLGLIQTVTSNVLSSSRIPIEYRKAIDRQMGEQPTLPVQTTVGTKEASTVVAAVSDHQDQKVSSSIEPVVQELQLQITTVLQLLQQEIAVDNINTLLYNKYTLHNQRANEQRNHMIQQYMSKQRWLSINHTKRHSLMMEYDIRYMVGYDVACTMTLHSYIRAVTDDEKKILQLQQQRSTNQQQQQSTPQLGLHVREEIYNDAMTIIQHVKKTPQNSYQVYQLRSILLNLSDTVSTTGSCSEHHITNDDNNSEVVNGNNHGTTTATTTTTTSSSGNNPNNMICDITLLSLVRRCVELGAFASLGDDPTTCSK